MRFSVEQCEELLTAECYREFLRRSLIIKARTSGCRLNLAAFARKANFSSRAFVGEVINGHKRITGGSLPKFIHALELKGLWATYFKLLVANEEKNVQVAGIPDRDVQSKLLTTRTRLRDRSRHFSTKSPANLLGSQTIFTVYAALGSQNRGAGLEQIASRSGLRPTKVKEVLDKLCHFGLVVANEGHYQASQSELDFGRLGEDGSFKHAFIESVVELGKRAEGMKLQPDNLFFHTAFAIDSRRLPEIRDRLRETLLEFLDQEQNEDGDTVKRITLGMF